ncbi:hypothetical protein [Dactylosporangium sp. CS-033363]|uniref:hypothetical protein n=1 Tax=Dactylosporangium sp. CS-033363 TaxID=3239935 RepID=UPI003D8AA532
MRELSRLADHLGAPAVARDEVLGHMGRTLLSTVVAEPDRMELVPGWLDQVDWLRRERRPWSR